MNPFNLAFGDGTEISASGAESSLSQRDKFFNFNDNSKNIRDMSNGFALDFKVLALFVIIVFLFLYFKR